MPALRRSQADPPHLQLQRSAYALLPYVQTAAPPATKLMSCRTAENRSAGPAAGREVLYEPRKDYSRFPTKMPTGRSRAGTGGTVGAHHLVSPRRDLARGRIGATRANPGFRGLARDSASREPSSLLPNIALPMSRAPSDPARKALGTWSDTSLRLPDQGAVIAIRAPAVGMHTPRSALPMLAALLSDFNSTLNGWAAYSSNEPSVQSRRSARMAWSPGESPTRRRPPMNCVSRTSWR